MTLQRKILPVKCGISLNLPGCSVWDFTILYHPVTHVESSFMSTFMWRQPFSASGSSLWSPGRLFPSQYDMEDKVNFNFYGVFIASVNLVHCRMFSLVNMSLVIIVYMGCMMTMTWTSFQEERGSMIKKWFSHIIFGHSSDPYFYPKCEK